LLGKKIYTYKVDVWAIGIMCFEMLMGRTPFHAYEMKDLISKIRKGDYALIIREKITIECALFLTQCLQANETERLSVERLLVHPFLQLNKVDANNFIMTKLDKR
jgi:aurora kinase, other